MKADNEQEKRAIDGARPIGYRVDPDVIRVMTERIAHTFHPIRVILFGSRARGTGHEGSDVDLLVVFEKCGDKHEAAVAVRRLLSDLPAAKDVIVTTPEEIERRGRMPGSVLRSALEEGRVLYERS